MKSIGKPVFTQRCFPYGAAGFCIGIPKTVLFSSTATAHTNSTSSRIYEVGPLKHNMHHYYTVLLRTGNLARFKVSYLDNENNKFSKI